MNTQIDTETLTTQYPTTPEERSAILAAFSHEELRLYFLEIRTRNSLELWSEQYDFWSDPSRLIPSLSIKLWGSFELAGANTCTEKCIWDEIATRYFGAIQGSALTPTERVLYMH
jgi:hypothetical protein